MKTIHHGVSAAALATLLVLAGCGKQDAGNDNAAGSDSGSPTAGQAAQARGPAGGRFEEIEECLKAAGLEDKLPQRPSDMPSDMPSGPPPERPSGAPEGGGMMAMQDEDVRNALKACGIELPEGPPQQSVN